MEDITIPLDSVRLAHKEVFSSGIAQYLAMVLEGHSLPSIEVAYCHQENCFDIMDGTHRSVSSYITGKKDISARIEWCEADCGQCVRRLFDEGPISGFIYADNDNSLYNPDILVDSIENSRLSSS